MLIPLKLIQSKISKEMDQMPDIWWIPYENIYKVVEGAGHCDPPAQSRILFLHGHDQYIMPCELTATQLAQYINDCQKCACAHDLLTMLKERHGE